MDWDDFVSEYQRFYTGSNRASQPEETVAIERLRGLAETVAGDEQRDRARSYVATLEEDNRPIRRVGDGLWGRINDAVQDETGADKSLWDYGKVDSNPEMKARATATWDGTIFLNEQVVQPLQDLYDKRGQPSTEQERIERRTALQDAVRPFVHLVAPSTYEHYRRSHDTQQPQYTAIVQGVAAAWSHGRLDQLADIVLPPDLAAEVKSVQSPQAFPDLAPAAQRFAERVGAEVGMDTYEVLGRMTRESPTQHAAVAAELLFENSELSELISSHWGSEIEASIDQGSAGPQPLGADRPVERVDISRGISGSRGDAFGEIQAVIHQGFADVRPSPADGSVDRREISSQRGQQIAQSAVDKVQQLEQRFSQRREREVGLEAFAEHVGAELGQDRYEVLGRLNAAEQARKVGVASAVLFEGSNLPDLIPGRSEGKPFGEEWEAARQEIEAVIDQGFAELRPLNADRSAEGLDAAGRRGQEIARSAVGKVHELEQRYGQRPEREAGQEAAREVADLGALPPPNAADQREAAALPANPPQQVPAAEQQGSAQQAVDPEVAGLRAVLAPQAPAAGAPRLEHGKAVQGRPGGVQAAGRRTEAPDRSTKPDVPSR